MCLYNILFNYKYSDLICWYLKSKCSFIEKLGLRKQLIKINSLSNAPVTADKQEKNPNSHSYCQSSTWEVKTEWWQPQTLLSIGILLLQQQGQCSEELQAPGLGRWAIPSSRPTALHHGHQPLSILPLPLLLASWVAFYNLAVAVSISALTVSMAPVTPQGCLHCCSHPWSRELL